MHCPILTMTVVGSYYLRETRQGLHYSSYWKGIGCFSVLMRSVVREERLNGFLCWTESPCLIFCWCLVNVLKIEQYIVLLKWTWLVERHQKNERWSGKEGWRNTKMIVDSCSESNKNLINPLSIFIANRKNKKECCSWSYVNFKQRWEKKTSQSYVRIIAIIFSLLQKIF